ncbi:MAG: T9SS type A sorting domain-containing protein [Crocinitomicaceae bacterium]
MLRFYTFFFTLFIGVGLMAQQVEIHLDNDPGTNYNGQVVDLTIPYNDYTIYAHVENVSGATIDFKFRRVIISSGASFTDQFCDNNLCYPVSGTDWTTPSAVPISAGDSSLMKPILSFTDGGPVLLRYYVLDGSDNKLDSIDFNITSTVGFEEMQNISVSAYPNPANQDFNIDFKGVNGANYQVVIYNLLGEEVNKRSLSNGLNTLNIDNLNNGVYFYSILLNSEVIETKKLIIRHQ